VAAYRGHGARAAVVGPSIRTFRVLAQPFTEEHGLLTPSLKMRRRAVEKAYENEVAALYQV
jgi:long-chain acyl-CoA synthetase